MAQGTETHTAIQLHILMIGTTGNGKSNAGNVLSETKTFLSQPSPVGVTKDVKSVSTSLVDSERKCEYRMTITDTPGLLDTEKTVEEVEREIAEAVLAVADGINAFPIVCSMLGRALSIDQVNVLRFALKFLFPGSANNAFLLFTHSDVLRKQHLLDPSSTSPEQWMAQFRRSTIGREILNLVQDRHFIFDGAPCFGTTNATRQRLEFFRFIHSSFPTKYSSALFQSAQSILKRQRDEEKSLSDQNSQILAMRQEIAQLRETLMKTAPLSSPGSGGPDGGDMIYASMFGGMFTGLGTAMLTGGCIIS